MNRFREWKERQRNKCVVRIKNPRMGVKGKVYPNCLDNNKTFVAFCGIPYAEPPVDTLRFQPPKPYRVPVFNYIHRAYDVENPCLQYGDDYMPSGSEDCLYMNIYLPRKPKRIKTPLPVLVYIHGGGFDHGSGDLPDIKPDNIIRQNLVFVTINYRLSVFGFLNMGTENCKGNAGLKDQVLALKWINDNIKRFGGDKENITISGHSAGASCVNLHMISPLSKGLFHKAIVQSGGIYCPWGYLGNQQRVGRVFSRVMHADAKLWVASLLKYHKPNKLLDIMGNINDNVCRIDSKRLAIFMGPTLEMDKEDAFLPYDIEFLKRQAEPVPLMAGICEGEGFMFLQDQARGYPYGFKPLIMEDPEFIDFLMQNFRWSEETAVRHKDTIRNLYFPNLDAMSYNELAKGLSDLNTDIWHRRFYDSFNIGDDIPAPFYVYKFSYIAPNDRDRKVDDAKPSMTIIITAPMHGDETIYQYGPELFEKLDEDEYSEEKKTMMNTMGSLLAMFCRTGDFQTSILHRGVEWRPHTESRPRFLNIDRRLTTKKGRLNEDRWRNLNEIIEAESRVETPSLICFN